MLSENTTRPILVTGSHRAGTTWVGKIIAFAENVAYISEPFTLHHRLGIFNCKIDFWYQCIHKGNEENFLLPFQNMLEFKYNYVSEIASLKNFKDIVRMCRDIFLFRYYKKTKKRPLIKESLSFFSAEWIAKNFDADVLIMIRHPAAFVGSLKKGNTLFPFEHLLKQKIFIDDYIGSFESQINKFSKSNKDIIQQGVLLWKIIHRTIISYYEKYPSWNFYRHEDISRDPIGKFNEIYLKLGLQMNEKITKKISANSFANKKKDDTIDGKEIKRNSLDNIFSWKTRLTQDEINYIKNETFDMASYFYSDSEW